MNTAMYVLVAVGGLSLATTAVQAQYVVTQPSASSISAAFPTAPPEGPAGVQHPRLAPGERNSGLMIGGITVLVVGYLAGSIVPFLMATHSGPGSVFDVLAWVPFAHWTATFATQDQAQGTPALLFGIAGTVLEAVGLVLTIVGATSTGPERLVDRRFGVRLDVRPTAPGAELGASAVLRF